MLQSNKNSACYKKCGIFLIPSLFFTNVKNNNPTLYKIQYLQKYFFMVKNLLYMNHMARFLDFYDQLREKKIKNFCSAERFLTLCWKKTAIYHKSVCVILTRQKASTKSLYYIV
jgi:hypothetical protein